MAGVRVVRGQGRESVSRRAREVKRERERKWERGAMQRVFISFYIHYKLSSIHKTRAESGKRRVAAAGCCSCCCCYCCCYLQNFAALLMPLMLLLRSSPHPHTHARTHILTMLPLRLRLPNWCCCCCYAAADAGVLVCRRPSTVSLFSLPLAFCCFTSCSHLLLLLPALLALFPAVSSSV